MLLGELLETGPDHCLAPEQIEKLVASWMSGHHAASMFASLEQPSALGFPGCALRLAVRERGSPHSLPTLYQPIGERQQSFWNVPPGLIRLPWTMVESGQSSLSAGNQTIGITVDTLRFAWESTIAKC